MGILCQTQELLCQLVYSFPLVGLFPPFDSQFLVSLIVMWISWWQQIVGSCFLIQLSLKKSQKIFWKGQGSLHSRLSFEIYCCWWFVNFQSLGAHFLLWKLPEVYWLFAMLEWWSFSSSLFLSCCVCFLVLMDKVDFPLPLWSVPLRTSCAYLEYSYFSVNFNR